jgi:transmembrane sensor
MSETPDKAIAQAAAEWAIRSSRGLTPAEQDGFCEWLAADSRHGAELARHQQTWKQLDQLVEWRPEHTAQPNPDLLAPPFRSRVVRFAPWVVALAAAAAVALMIFPTRPTPLDTGNAGRAEVMAPAGPLVLEDGSIVELNAGARVTAHFSPTERRVRLESGEAHFAVTKNPVRPFIVSAGGIDVRAVGTAFNVRFGKAAVEVLVTEGKVQVDTTHETTLADISRPEHAIAPPLVPALVARQRAILRTDRPTEPPQIATLSVGEIDRVLAWQHRMLEFNATPLTQVVQEFNRRNVVQLVIADPALEAIGISGRFRTDNIELLATLLEKQFGVRVEQSSETEMTLGRTGGTP